MYTKFCDLIQIAPVPATTTTICRYAAFLARTKCLSTIKQYLNVIRIINAEFSLPNPLGGWELKTVLGGIKRHKGEARNQKSPLLPEHLSLLFKSLDLDNLEHLQLWCISLTAFFGLLRVSNVTSKSQTSPGLCILRNDIIFKTQGCVLLVRKSKTNQYQAKPHEVVLPYVPNSILCPVTALARYLSRTQAIPATSPISMGLNGSRHIALTQGNFRKRLTSALKDIGLPSELYNTHSLRRGGATWLLSTGVPLAMVKSIGDWASDAVFAYFKPNTDLKFNSVKSACLNL